MIQRRPKHVCPADNHGGTLLSRRKSHEVVSSGEQYIVPDSAPDNPSRTMSQLPEVLADAQLRLFFGGSFDPPHSGHASLPRAIAEHLHAPFAPIVYVPAARSPHKHSQPTPSAHRLAMMELALSEVANAWIWTEEIARSTQAPGVPSYWATTWKIVQERYPHGSNRFLIGADQLVAMHRWHEYETIWQDATVMLRDDHDDPEQLLGTLRSLGVWDAGQIEQWRAQICTVPTLDVSSTRIRQALGDPTQRENPIAGLDDRVHKYILEQGLYTLA